MILRMTKTNPSRVKVEVVFLSTITYTNLQTKQNVWLDPLPPLTTHKSFGSGKEI